MNTEDWKNYKEKLLLYFLRGSVSEVDAIYPIIESANCTEISQNIYVEIVQDRGIELRFHEESLGRQDIEVFWRESDIFGTRALLICLDVSQPIGISEFWDVRNKWMYYEISKDNLTEYIYNIWEVSAD